MEYHLSAVVIRGDRFFVARGVEVELASQGRTVEEALKNLKEAFVLWLKHAEPDELKIFSATVAPLVTQVAVVA